MNKVVITHTGLSYWVTVRTTLFSLNKNPVEMEGLIFSEDICSINKNCKYINGATKDDGRIISNLKNKI